MLPVSLVITLKDILIIGGLIAIIVVIVTLIVRINKKESEQKDDK